MLCFFSKNQGVSAPPCLALTFIGAMGVQVVLRQRWEAINGDMSSYLLVPIIFWE